jgi:hypothetical protein
MSTVSVSLVSAAVMAEYLEALAAFNVSTEVDMKVVMVASLREMIGAVKG